MANGQAHKSFWNLNLNDQITFSNKQYEPVSVIVHKGNSPTSGHYYLLQKQNDNTVVEFNDARILNYEHSLE